MYLEILYIMSVLSHLYWLSWPTRSFASWRNWMEMTRNPHLTGFSTSRCIFERLWMKCLDWVSNWLSTLKNYEPIICSRYDYRDWWIMNGLWCRLIVVSNGRICNFRWRSHKSWFHDFLSFLYAFVSSIVCLL